MLSDAAGIKRKAAAFLNPLNYYIFCYIYFQGNNWTF
jgi:hypothetical protein